MNKDQGNGWLEYNRTMWDERVSIHLKGPYYDVESFKNGEERLPAFELEEVGDVSGKDLLHLQCHFGIDTLSWARRGARVVGLDFSLSAVEAARALAAEMRLDGEFVCGNVYDAAEVLGGQTFDVVYTNLGSLGWLPDVDRWARVVSCLVRPGGFLYLSEAHPFTDVFADEDLSVTDDYFREEPYVWDEPGSYADVTAETTHNRSYVWTHGLGEVVSAVVRAGLAVELLHEHDHTFFPRWPFMVKEGFGTYRLPQSTPRLPLMYSLRARQPYRRRRRVPKH